MPFNNMKRYKILKFPGCCYLRKRFVGYKEIITDYAEPYKDRNFINAFGNSYYKYGLYVFFEKNNGKVFYIGEAHDQIIGDRLSQHFRDSDSGGLRVTYKNDNQAISKIDNSKVLILYKDNSKDVIFDQDLLIGIFKPELNKQ